MVVADRGSYFLLDVKIDNIYGLSFQKLEQMIEDEIDIILASMTATNNVYKFQNKNRCLYLFSTHKRKRKGQLVKLVEDRLKKKELVTEYNTIPFLKTEFTQALHKFKKDLRLVKEPKRFDGYSGEDLEIFKDRSKWYSWQDDLHKELFHSSGVIRKADPRKITFIYDEKGNCGKSVFFKYLFCSYPEDIGRITFGTASQLRSSIVNMGPKKIYIMDLPRSKGKYDESSDLISALADTKNGCVSQMMYGTGETLIMDIPHIIVCSNYLFDPGSLSQDRWNILAIKNNRFKNITKEVKLNLIQQKIISK